MTTITLEEPLAASGFALLPLKPDTLAAVARAGYITPTPVQDAVIPEAVAGRDVIGQAKTGTGKTAAFLLPFLDSWKGAEEENGPFAIVMAPTRELVVQVADECSRLTPHPDLRCAAIIGGARMRTQINQLKRGCALIVGTPGRVIDLMRRGALSLDRVRYAVLDEADRMLDIGFRPDIERILKRCPSGRQTLLMSATMPPPVMKLTERYMMNPIHLNLAPETVTVEKIRQSYITVDEDRKFELLRLLIERENPRQMLIFCERKKWVEEVYFMLRQHFRLAACMHGDLSQGLRNRIMQGYRDGKIRFLVATDVVGRGIDVKNISHVVNYDIPEDPENYVHRIGRTGRIGADGIAILFATPEQGEQLTGIELFINKVVGEEKVEGFDAARLRPTRADLAAPDPEKKSQPVYGRRVKKYSKRV